MLTWKSSLHKKILLILEKKEKEKEKEKVL
jgi:hypothetical protein